MITLVAQDEHAGTHVRVYKRTCACDTESTTWSTCCLTVMGLKTGDYEF
jgi:hypothetical protein